MSCDHPSSARTGRRTLGVVASILATAILVAACGDDGSAEATAASDRAITVAAASDLRFAFEELGDRFTQDSGIAVTFSFGSSGQLREQIVNGAPFDLFASANVAFVDEVIEAGRGDPDTKTDYAIGRIVLWAPPDQLPGSIDELTDSRYERIAIANPTHAPYGLAARQALESAGIRETVEDRLIYGENVSDALRIARSGNADVGIVALSLVITGDAPFVLLDDALHEPLRQALVVTGVGARAQDATAFAEFLATPAGREVMVRYGFALPGEDLPI